jgi:transcriptional regulator with XRE-family HTH domain
MDVDQKIRLRIRQEMKRQNITQAELARRLSIKPPSLAQILSGHRGILPESLMNVLAALGLTIEILPSDLAQTGLQPENK